MADDGQKAKWQKVGSMLRSKKTNEDGSDRFYFKVADKDITLKAGESLSMFTPKNANAPEFVIYDVCRKLS